METIFLLEDDAALSRGIAMALSGPDRAVTQADTVAGARETLTRAGFDLLILDVNLPDGSGLELLRALRQEGDRTPATGEGRGADLPRRGGEGGEEREGREEGGAITSASAPLAKFASSSEFLLIH